MNIYLIMCDKILKYINDNNEKDIFIIYEELIIKYPLEVLEINYVLYYEYNIDIDLYKEDNSNKQLTDVRFYQQQLRKKALIKFNNKCVISGIDREICLEVAHIKSVSDCINTYEKMDIYNTLLLWIDIHKYFDNYLISINPKTSMTEIKEIINKSDYEFLTKYKNIKVNLDIENIKYIKHHYDIFIKN